MAFFDGFKRVITDKFGNINIGDNFFIGDGSKLKNLTAALSTMQTTVLLTDDVSLASYADKSINTNTPASIPTNLRFNTTGTAFYIANAITIYQFACSTPYDVSTGNYANKSFSCVGETGNVQGFTFNSDLSKMYVMDFTNSRIRQYNLGTAGDVSTASYASKYISTAGYAPRGLRLSPDGTKLFFVDVTAARVVQFNLSIADDISTATDSLKYFSTSSQESEPRDLFINSDGTKIYVVGTGGTKTVYQYNLTAYDASTGSYASKSFYVGTQSATPRGLAFSPDMTKMYIAENTGHYVYQYTLMTGSSVFSQPIQKTNYKNVIIYLNALNGAASYTFPTAFSYTPQILSQSLAAKVSALSTSTVTVTGTNDTGFIELMGY